MRQLTLTRPDDWHVHLRDGAALVSLVPHTARQFARAIVMPNLKPPVTTVAQALAYRGRILDALPRGTRFQPLLTLYLTERTPAAEIARAKDSGAVFGVKLYPVGATTNAEAGVGDWQRCLPALERMQELGLPLLVHGELPGDEVDVFQREPEFIAKVLLPLTARLPKLKVVLEHITTVAAVDFVLASGPQVAATITPQHLLYTRNAMFKGGLRPHYYCLPVLKREADRQALLTAATGGNPKFFLGTDSAPHARHLKESACGCAGCFTAFAALELYAEAFDQVGALDRLEAFAAHHGPDFYGLPRNSGRVTLVQQRWDAPAELPCGDDVVVPFRAGEPLAWQMADG